MHTFDIDLLANLPDHWPPRLRFGLLAGVSTGGALLDCAREAFDGASAAGSGEGSVDIPLFTLAMQLLLAAWEADPLDGRLAVQWLQLADRSGYPATGPATTLVRGVAQMTLAENGEPERAEQYRRLLARGDGERARDYLTERIVAEPDRLHWWREGVSLARNADGVGPQWMQALQQAHWPSDGIAGEVFGQLGQRLRADLHLMAGEFDGAATAYAAAGAFMGQPVTGILFATALRRADPANGTAAAMARLGAVVRFFPWCANAVHALAALAAGHHEATQEPDGTTAVCLYSHNKAEALDATLASLAQSNLQSTRLYLLDNASTDATPDVLAGWASRLGERVAETVRLPTNVGAPAARNWLMTLSGVREADHVAFLDDDVALPADWLGRLMACRAVLPHAGVWGAKVVDAANPARIQCADLHLREPEGDSSIRLTDLQMQSFDGGQFDAMRACISVTGCCHLFDTARLYACGEFDIRYSPTQFDDVDHDLRMAEAGLYAGYTGFLTVRHAKSTGMRALRDAAAAGSGAGNEVKLATRHAAHAARLYANQYDVLVADMVRALSFIAQASDTPAQ